jgi:GntR family transcriptional repressor for pyruvate dehydrogenase complex
VDRTLEELISVLMSSSDGQQGGQVRVPTERDLAAILGVNRSTVRERLSALEVLGLIQRTQGSGTYLGMPHPSFLRLYFDTARRLGQIEYRHLERAREAIDRAAAREAAQSATLADLAVLEGHLQDMLGCDTVAKGVEADVEFHLQLVRASKNPVLVLLGEGLSASVRHLLEDKRRSFPQTDPRTSCVNTVHIPIVEALRARDAQAAEQAVDHHYEVLNDGVAADPP